MQDYQKLIIFTTPTLGGVRWNDAKQLQQTDFYFTVYLVALGLFRL